MVEYKYRFPEHSDNIDNRDIFGEQNKYNFFIGARGLTFLGTYDEFVKGFPMENEITSKIPMGYKALCLYERLSIIEKGKIIWSNSDVNAINVEKLKYGDFYYTKEKKYVKDLYIVFDSNEDLYRSDYDYEFDSYDKAIKYFIKFSKERNNKFLICKLLAWESWH